MHESLQHFVAARNTSTSAALGELAVVNPRCRNYQFGWSFLPAAVRRVYYFWRWHPNRF